VPDLTSTKFSCGLTINLQSWQHVPQNSFGSTQPEKLNFVRNTLSEKYFWLLLVISLLCYIRPLLFGETFFFRDLYIHHLPAKSLLVDLVLSGRYIDPYSNGGEPFFSNMNNMSMYPTNILYFVLPLMTTFNLEIVFHLTLCGIATYLLARLLGLGGLAAFAAAIIFQFSGYISSTPNLWFYAPAHLPLLILFWHLHLQRKSALLLAVSVVLGALQVFAGHPEISLFTLILLLIWTAFYGYDIPLPRLMFRFFILVLLIVGLSSIQLLPMMDLTSQSSRAKGLSYESFATWSLHPKRLPEIVLPQFLGRTDTLSAGDYYGGKIEDQHFPYILSIYIGFVSILLAIYGTRKLESNFIFRSGFIRMLWIVILVSLIFAIGRYLPFFKFFYDFVPLISVFRYPIKFLILAILPLSMLAGRGVQLLQDDTAAGKSLFWYMTAACVCMILVLLPYLFSVSFSSSVCNFFFSTTAASALLGIRTSLFHAVAVLVGSAAAAYWLPNKNALHLLVAILVFDLLVSARFVNPTAARDLFEKEPSSISAIRKVTKNGRLYREPEKQIPILRAPSNRVEWQYRWNLETVNFHLGTYFKIPTVYFTTPDRLTSKRMTNLTTIVNSLPWRRRAPLLSAAGVTSIVAESQIQVSGIERVDRLVNGSNISFWIYRNRLAAADPMFYTAGMLVSNEEQATRALLAQNFDPSRYAVLEYSRAIQNCDTAAPTKFSRKETDEWHIENSCDGFLVFPRTFYKGYYVKVDEKETSIFYANLAFFGAYVPAGKHTVSVGFLPESFLLGGAISVLTAVVLLTFAKKLI
jgi:hypothetical protein